MKQIVAALLVLAWGAEAQAPSGSALPIRRVMLYKHGVAYFERAGKTAGVREILLEFKASEMDDVLKSLTLLDRSGGKVGSVSYEASDPLAKRLEDFGFSVSKEASLGSILDQFKGARLIVKTQGGGELRGQILSVRSSFRDATEIDTAALLLESGEMRNVVLTEAAEVRLEDPRMQRDLASFLTILAGARRRDRRVLKILPGSAAELSVGYVIEAPVWKSSYRLVLDGKRPGEALLQGWAIVDNPTGEDWMDVDLSLVSGLPISFTQNLYEPHYMTRPKVALPFELAAAPLVHEGRILEEKNEVAQGVDQDKTVGAKSANMRRGMAVGGAGVGAMNMAPAAPPPPREMREVLESTVTAATQGRELGELFEYKVDKRIDIPRSQSALIPFVQSAVKAERVLLFDPSSGRDNPYDAVLLTNTSGVTLDGGAITVLDGDRYAGEALIDNVKTGDSRPVSFAVDLGTQVTTAFDSKYDQVFAVKVRRGVMTTTAKNVDVRTYTVRNSDAKAKTLVIQHPVRRGWKPSPGSPKPEETTAKNYRFRVPLPAQATAKLAVSEEQEVSNTIALNNLNSEMIAGYARNKALTPEGQKQLQAILTLKDRLAETQRRINERQQEIAELGRDQDRLRQNINNLRSLPGQTDQVNRYAAKLSEQEKIMEGLQASLNTERAQLRTQQQELDRLMNSLEI